LLLIPNGAAIQFVEDVSLDHTRLEGLRGRAIIDHAAGVTIRQTNQLNSRGWEVIG
jgi:hypothetical protein